MTLLCLWVAAGTRGEDRFLFSAFQNKEQKHARPLKKTIVSSEFQSKLFGPLQEWSIQFFFFFFLFGSCCFNIFCFHFERAGALGPSGTFRFPENIMENSSAADDGDDGDDDAQFLLAGNFVFVVFRLLLVLGITAAAAAAFHSVAQHKPIWLRQPPPSLYTRYTRCRCCCCCRCCYIYFFIFCLLFVSVCLLL